MKEFSQKVQDQLKFYVYYLRDPRNKEVFYVGKGKGNRVFQHLECALEIEIESDKLDKIRDILDAGLSVEHYILRHGLTEEIAYEIEDSLIDFLGGVDKLTNKQDGHDSNECGIKTVEEIEMQYNAQKLESDLPILLININALYKTSLKPNELYEATRSSWKLGERRNKVKYVLAVYKGLIREVYQVDKWKPCENRWEFEGKIADKDIREKLIHTDATSFYKRGSANPVKYYNC